MQFIIYAIIGALIGQILTLLLRNTENYRLLIDESLWPPIPAPDATVPTSHAAKAVLTAFVNDIVARHGRSGLRALCPVKVVEGNVSERENRGVPLREDIGPWLLRYETGERATAISPEGTRLGIDVGHESKTTRADQPRIRIAVKLASGESHQAWAPATVIKRTTHVRVRGRGVFRTYERVNHAGPGTEPVVHYFRKLAA